MNIEGAVIIWIWKGQVVQTKAEKSSVFAFSFFCFAGFSDNFLWPRPGGNCRYVLLPGRMARREGGERGGVRAPQGAPQGRFCRFTPLQGQDMSGSQSPLLLSLPTIQIFKSLWFSQFKKEGLTYVGCSCVFVVSTLVLCCCFAVVPVFPVGCLLHIW